WQPSQERRNSVVDRQRVAALAGALGPSGAPGTERQRHAAGISRPIGGTHAPPRYCRRRPGVHPPSAAAARPVSLARASPLFRRVPLTGAHRPDILHLAEPAASRAVESLGAKTGDAGQKIKPPPPHPLAQE